MPDEVVARKMFKKRVLDEQFKRISQELGSKVEAFVIGGYAMMVHKRKKATKDVDLVFRDNATMQVFVRAAKAAGFYRLDGLPEEYRALGSRNVLDGPGGIRIDVFMTTVCDAITVSPAMRRRALFHPFPGKLTLLIATTEDIFLFKSITSRPEDLLDMSKLYSMDFDWDAIEKEVRSQKDDWRWIIRLYLRLLELEEEYDIRSPLLKHIEQEAEIYEAMGIVLERLERGPFAEKDVPALLQEEDGEFVSKVMKELRKRRLVTTGKEFRKRMDVKGSTPKDLKKKG